MQLIGRGFGEIFAVWIDETLHMNLGEVINKLRENNFEYLEETIYDYLKGDRKPPGTFFAHLHLTFQVTREEVAMWAETLGVDLVAELVVKLAVNGRIGNGITEIQIKYVAEIMEDYDRELRKYEGTVHRSRANIWKLLKLWLSRLRS